MDLLLEKIVAGEPVEQIADILFRMSESWEQNNLFTAGFVMRGWRNACSALGHHDVAERVWELQQRWAARITGNTEPAMIDSTQPRISPFIHHVRAAMLRRGMTQTELAERAGTSQSRISLILAGKSDLMYSMAERIAAALGIEIVSESECESR